MSSDLAKQMWDAYAKQAGGVTFDGKPLPDWDGLGEDRQSCWVAAARVAVDRIGALEDALRRLVAWGAACPTEREERLSHAAEGAKAFHAARAALGEDVHD